MKGGKEKEKRSWKRVKKVACCHAYGPCRKINCVLRALLCHPPPHTPAQCYDVCVNVHATVHAVMVHVCVCINIQYIRQLACCGGLTLLFWGGSYIYWALEEMFDTPQTIQQEVESRICVHI